ncbi:MAG: hypothetical protein JXR79_06760 [Nitrospirae bacterium]|nr:hypothetical protein [Nitrospirota bacterium]
MNDDRKAYVEKLDAQLDELDIQIAMRKDRAKLDELMTVADEAWEDLKINVFSRTNSIFKQAPMPRNTLDKLNSTKLNMIREKTQ